MQNQISNKSHKILFFNTLAFTVCFAVWMLNGVLITFLADNQVFNWGPVEIGWLIGIPILTGSIFRFPAGILTDKYGGKPIFIILLLLCVVPLFLLSYANSFLTFALCSFGFGLAGAGFSVGIAFSSIWYPKKNQGFALGIFGAGNAGAAVTTAFAPTLLNIFTDNASNIEGWRNLPKLYGLILFITSIIFLIFTENKKPKYSNKNFATILKPLKDIRVWRFGLYYFLTFGCFVAFANWLVPYFINVYYLPLVTAGILAACFSFPSGIIRIPGGFWSDKFGARTIMYGVLISSVIICFLLVIPCMKIYLPGQGIMAKSDGIVKYLSKNKIIVGKFFYNIKEKPINFINMEKGVFVFPTKETWHNVRVKIGQKVKKKDLLANGITRISFQANMWIFASLVILLGLIWGIGNAAVFKHIANYYPEQVGVVGGMVGVLGGLGGSSCPVIFGYLLGKTGFWSSCWILMLILSIICLLWMHRIIVNKF